MNGMRSLILLSMMLVAAAGCTMRGSGTMAAPAFKRSSRQHPLPVTPRTHRAGDVEVRMVSGFITESYTAVGSEDFTAYLTVTLVNAGAEPVKVEMNSMSAQRVSGGLGTAVYFGTVNLLPSTQADVKIAIPAGLSRLDMPVALIYNGVRMNLN